MDEGRPPSPAEQHASPHELRNGDTFTETKAKLGAAEMHLRMEVVRSNQSESTIQWGDIGKELVKQVSMKKRLGQPISLRIPTLLSDLQTSVPMNTLQQMFERLERFCAEHNLRVNRKAAQVATPAQPKPHSTFLISADMFKIEISHTGATVKDVRMALNNAKPAKPTNCPHMLEALRKLSLHVFLEHLRGLLSMYYFCIEQKTKNCFPVVLQSLEKDLENLASIPSPGRLTVLVHKTPLGSHTTRCEGLPVSLTYFVLPTDFLNPKTGESLPRTVETIREKKLGRKLSIGIEGSVARHKLQTIPLMTTSKSASATSDNLGKPKSLPSFSALTNVNSVSLPAVFTMRLDHPVVLPDVIVAKIEKLTETPFASSSLKRGRLLDLLIDQANVKREWTGDEAQRELAPFYVSLPGQKHAYHFTQDCDYGYQGACLIDKIPFSHPTHVPKIIIDVRAQVAHNTILLSCLRPGGSKEPAGSIVVEVNPVSVSVAEVTFKHPSHQSLVSVDFDISDMTHLKCRIYLGATQSCPPTLATKVFQRSFSIPVTVRSIIDQLEGKNVLNPALSVTNSTTASDTQPFIEAAAANSESPSIVNADTMLTLANLLRQKGDYVPYGSTHSMISGYRQDVPPSSYTASSHSFPTYSARRKTNEEENRERTASAASSQEKGDQGGLCSSQRAGSRLMMMNSSNPMLVSLLGEEGSSNQPLSSRNGLAVSTASAASSHRVGSTSAAPLISPPMTRPNSLAMTSASYQSSAAPILTDLLEGKGAEHAPSDNNTLAGAGNKSAKRVKKKRTTSETEGGNGPRGVDGAPATPGRKRKRSIADDVGPASSTGALKGQYSVGDTSSMLASALSSPSSRGESTGLLNKKLMSPSTQRHLSFNDLATSAAGVPGLTGGNNAMFGLPESTAGLLHHPGMTGLAQRQKSSEQKNLLQLLSSSSPLSGSAGDLGKIKKEPTMGAESGVGTDGVSRDIPSAGGGGVSPIGPQPKGRGRPLKRTYSLVSDDGEEIGKPNAPPHRLSREDSHSSVGKEGKGRGKSMKIKTEDRHGSSDKLPGSTYGSTEMVSPASKERKKATSNDSPRYDPSLNRADSIGSVGKPEGGSLGMLSNIKTEPSGAPAVKKKVGRPPLARKDDGMPGVPRKSKPKVKHNAGKVSITAERSQTKKVTGIAGPSAGGMLGATGGATKNKDPQVKLKEAKAAKAKKEAEVLSEVYRPMPKIARIPKKSTSATPGAGEATDQRSLTSPTFSSGSISGPSPTPTSLHGLSNASSSLHSSPAPGVNANNVGGRMSGSCPVGSGSNGGRPGLLPTPPPGLRVSPQTGVLPQQATKQRKASLDDMISKLNKRSTDGIPGVVSRENHVELLSPDPFGPARPLSFRDGTMSPAAPLSPALSNQVATAEPKSIPLYEETAGRRGSQPHMPTPPHRGAPTPPHRMDSPYGGVPRSYSPLTRGPSMGGVPQNRGVNAGPYIGQAPGIMPPVRASQQQNNHGGGNHGGGIHGGPFNMSDGGLGDPYRGRQQQYHHRPRPSYPSHPNNSSGGHHIEEDIGDSAVSM